MEKTLRVLGSGEEGEGGHSHSHSHSNGNSRAINSDEASKASGVGISSEDGLRKRKNGEVSEAWSESNKSANSGPTGPSKMSAYLNLFGDFVHNMYVNLVIFFTIPFSNLLSKLSTDGLA